MEIGTKGWGAITAIVLTVGGIAFAWGDEEKRDPVVTVGNPEQRALLETLRELRAAWHPDKKQRLEEKLREESERWLAVLPWLIEQSAHPYCVDGVQMLGVLQNGDSLGWAQSIALEGHTSLRPAGIVAAHRIAAWQPSELVTFLGDEDPAVRKASLEAIAMGDDYGDPFQDEDLDEALVAILGADDAALWEGAVAALPGRYAGERGERARPEAHADGERPLCLAYVHEA